jgi:hypothetical protein
MRRRAEARCIFRGDLADGEEESRVIWEAGRVGEIPWRAVVFWFRASILCAGGRGWDNVLPVKRCGLSEVGRLVELICYQHVRPKTFST